MSEVKQYKFDLSVTNQPPFDEWLVLKSDYDKLKENLTTFEGMTFSENQEIAKLKQAVEKLVECVKDHAEGGNIENYGQLTDKFDEIAKELGIDIK